MKGIKFYPEWLEKRHENYFHHRMEENGKPVVCSAYFVKKRQDNSLVLELLDRNMKNNN